MRQSSSDYPFDVAMDVFYTFKTLMSKHKKSTTEILLANSDKFFDSLIKLLEHAELTEDYVTKRQTLEVLTEIFSGHERFDLREKFIIHQDFICSVIRYLWNRNLQIRLRCLALMSQFSQYPLLTLLSSDEENDDDNDNNMEVSTANSDEIFKSSQLDSLSHLPSVSNNSTVKRRSEDSISRENDAGKSRRFKENDGNIGSVNLQSNEHSGIIAATQSNYVAKTENSGLKIFDSNNVIQSRLNKQSTSKPRIILPSQDRLIPLKDKIDEIPENFMLPSRKSRSKLEDFSQLYSSLDISYDDL